MSKSGYTNMAYINETTSLASGKGLTRTNYNSIINNKSASYGDISKTSLILCVHGNKFGMARCCDDVRIITSNQDFGENFNASDNHSCVSGRSSGDLHCHTEREEGMDKKARKKLILASILCVLFMIIEAVGGIMANSLAIATDAAHLLTDFAAFLVSLFSLWLASKPATKKMSFGWHRAEVIGATVSVLLIWVVTGILLYLAIERIISKDYEIEAEIMLITSGIGVIVNIIMGCTLHQHGHSHGGHGHSHDSIEKANKEDGGGSNINVRAAYIHVIGDFIQSLGVFVAALLIYFKPEWRIADPICTILFSILVLFTTLRILRDTVIVFMEGLPPGMSYSEVQETLLSIEGIVAVHNLRIWGLTTEKNAIVAHLAIKPGINAQEILQTASLKIRSKYKFYEMTLQVEEFHQEMESCNQCKPPK